MTSCGSGSCVEICNDDRRLAAASTLYCEILEGLTAEQRSLRGCSSVGRWCGESDTAGRREQVAESGEAQDAKDRLWAPAAE
jgi:hypothetical protein